MAGIHSQLIPPLLKKALLDLKNKKKFSLIDLGCGSGEILYCLKKDGYLKGARATGLDIKQKAIKAFKEKNPWARAILADALDLNKLKDGSFDLVICNQVIEHVEDDKILVLEINRLLKNGGVLYISSVLKKWYGLYWHRNKFGQIVVDPKHVREYPSLKEFRNLLTRQGFCVKTLKVYPGKFALGDYFLLLLAKFGILKFTNLRDYYLAHPKIFQLLKRLSFLPIPGYAIIEVIAEKMLK